MESFCATSAIEKSVKREFYISLPQQERRSIRTMAQRIYAQLYERTLVSKNPEDTIFLELKKLREDGLYNQGLLLKDLYLLDFLELNYHYPLCNIVVPAHPCAHDILFILSIVVPAHPCAHDIHNTPAEAFEKKRADILAAITVHYIATAKVDGVKGLTEIYKITHLNWLINSQFGCFGLYLNTV